MRKKWLYYLSSIALVLLLCLSISAPVSAAGQIQGQPSIASAVGWTGSDFRFTGNVSLGTGSNYVSTSGWGTDWVMGPRYIKAVNFGSDGSNYLTGYAFVPICYHNAGGVNNFNRPQAQDFHLGIGGFYQDWVNVNVTSWSEREVVLSDGEKCMVYTVGFDANLSTAVYGNTNITFAIYDWSNSPSRLIFQGLSSTIEQDVGFPLSWYGMDAGLNITYGNNQDSQALNQLVNQNQIMIQQNQQLLQQNINTYDMVASKMDLLGDKLLDNTDAINNPQWVQDANDAVDDAQNDAQDSADDSQDDVDSATTSLLDVVRQFVNAVVSASPTSCVLNGDLIPHLPLGSLDLCKESPPPAITALGSLLLIAFVVPLAYNTVKTIINLIGEFQR